MNVKKMSAHKYCLIFFALIIVILTRSLYKIAFHVYVYIYNNIKFFDRENIKRIKYIYYRLI